MYKKATKEVMVADMTLGVSTRSISCRVRWWGQKVGRGGGMRFAVQGRGKGGRLGDQAIACRACACEHKAAPTFPLDRHVYVLPQT